MFAESFGFKGVEFGNWVEQKRRQKDLNDAFDALMDMAAIMGVPAKAISLNGELSLAFGARGSGGVNPAAAHYESDKIVINLTKREGAGSLGHEFWHALDNYFSRMRGNRTSSYMTTATDVKLSSSGSSYVPYEGVRKEMIDAFGEVVRAIKMTEMKARSSKIDAKRTKEYWTTGEEMAARAFESYLISKLHDQNASDDYLANIVDQKTWDAMAALGMENEDSYPYPTAGEMPGIRAGFDKFFQTLETKETDKGTAIYSHSGNSIAIPASKWLSDAAIANEVENRISHFAHQPPVKIMDTAFGVLPGATRDSDISGAVHGGVIYLFRDQLAAMGDVKRTLFHEMLHYGLRRFLTRDQFISQMMKMYQRDKSIMKEADRWAATDEGKTAELFGGADYALARGVDEALAILAEPNQGESLMRTPLAILYRKVTHWMAGVAEFLGFPDQAAWLRGLKNVEAREYIQNIFQKIDRDDTPTSDRWDFTADPAFRSTTVNKAVSELNDRFAHAGTLSAWHKTVGTQFNLAKRNKYFRRTFDAVQNFINDTSFYATEAANLAPTLLPQLQSWKDIFRAATKPADNKALSKPVFEGTLIWGRDESGKLVKMTDLEAQYSGLTSEAKARMLLRKGIVTEAQLKRWQGSPLDIYDGAVRNRFNATFLKEGVVFTDAELKQHFLLTPKQIGLYREFRAATDKSLTNLAITDMLKFGGDDVAPIRDAALAEKDASKAGEMLADYLRSMADMDPERSKVLRDTADKMILKADRATDLIKRGYAPLSRFGHYTLDVVDEEGNRQYFGMFESKNDANKMAAQMKANYPESTMRQGTVSEEEYKLFAGVSPETLELFGEMLGLESDGKDAKDQAFQEYLKIAKSQRSAMKRLIQRKGIAGFSEDTTRVLAGFVYSNARQSSSNMHTGEIANSVNDIPQGMGEVKDQAWKLMNYVQNPQEEAQAIRGLLFAQYIGGSVASAMVNLTQPFTMTIPWLAQYGGIAKATKQMTLATKDALSKSTGDAKLDAALKHAEELGIVSPQEVHQMMAQAQGRGALQSGDDTKLGNAKAAASNSMSRVVLAWGKLFGVAEQFNRRSTFIAAYRTAVEQKIQNPMGFAEEAVESTQGIYNKGNKPVFGRGAVPGTLMTFKQFSINYVEMLDRMWRSGPEGKKATLYALGIMVLMAGVGGLPGADDLDDIISGLLQAMGYNFDSKAKRRAFLTEHLGSGAAKFIEHGVTGLPGAPIDVSGRLGLGNLIPGTGLLTKKTDHTRDVAELAGPAGDLVKRGFDAAGKLIQGEVVGAGLAISPLAIRNLEKAWDMQNMGMYRDQSKKMIIQTDTIDAISKGLGFNPYNVKIAQDSTGEVQRAIALNKLTESQIADKWAQGLFEKDPDKVQEARDVLSRWNRDNKDMQIRIQFSQIYKRVQSMKQTKEQRIMKTAPKEVRNTIRQELATQ
jgi:hypothetical protein